jgi:murein DD-endopeptidase MepM/ murein hydrolase activator NlpD
MMNAMKNSFKEDIPNDSEPVEKQDINPSRKNERGLFSRWTNSLIQMGLGESMIKFGANLLSVAAIVIVIWATLAFYRQSPGPFGANDAQAQNPAATPVVGLAPLSLFEDPILLGVPREARMRTNIPTRPRKDIEIYIVQEGDTIFGIAEKFGLEPETILWANYGTLVDDPHSLRPGQELIILPVNGVYWEWVGDKSFRAWAEYFHVTPEDIINFPANNLDPEAIGDIENPNIPIGTWLIIPGGKREFTNWSAPLGVTRENPASAQILGPGYCEPVSGGAVGFGVYVWPTNKHYLSGFDYSPKSNHWGIDLAGSEGEGVYAADAGVVVYSGWNEWGYGNVVMIDHGNGFQSLYAHLSAIHRSCGQSVGQGEGIGAIGSTGRSSGAHLHFELMTATWKVNPWDYLPPP